MRLGTGPAIAGVAAAVLLIAMFLNWFQLTGISAEGDFGELVPGASIEFGGEELEAAAEAAGEDTSANAWESFGFIDIVLVAAIVAALALVVVRARGVAVPAPLSTIVAALGGLAVILVLFRIISPPDLVDAFGGGGSVPDEVDLETDVGRELWAFVGLIAAAGIAYGGWRSMQEEGAAPPPPPTGGTATPPPPASATEAPPPPGSTA